MSYTKSSSSEHHWFVPGKVSCLLLPSLRNMKNISAQQLLLEPAPSPEAGGQGGTELFQSQSCLQPAQRVPTPEHWHRQVALTCLHAPVAPSVEAATAKLLPMEKDPKSRDLGLTVTLGAEEIDCKICTITSTHCTEIARHKLSQICFRDCQS